MTTSPRTGWRRRSPTSTTTTCRSWTPTATWPAWSPGPTRLPRWSTATRAMERAVARIDFDAIRANCARLKSELTDGAELCAVVKADGYGHGADGCADAALAGGATRLAVATATEAEQVGRRLQHIPLLTMGALSVEEVDVVLSAGSEVAVWHEDFRRLLAD